MTIKELEGLMQLNELSLTEAEQALVLTLADTMEQEEQLLQKYNTDTTEVMVHVMPLTNVLREDARKQPFSRESLLSAGSEHTEDSWQVPRLVK